MKRERRSYIVLGLSLSVMLGFGTRANAQSLTWLGTLPGGYGSGARGVSADGTVVIGWVDNASGQQRAFRWTLSGGMQDLGVLGGYESEASGVSADGTVVVGVAYDASGRSRAFRWTPSDGMQGLATLPGGYESGARGVSADGTVVFGWAEGIYERPACIWTASGEIQAIRLLEENDVGEAYGVSADGSVVVGWTYNSNAIEQGFRWTQSGGMQLWISDLSGVLGVTWDGSVAVGWDVAGPFRWMASGELEYLNSVYASLLTDDSYLAAAYAISPDGRYIVGVGYNAATERGEAYLLDTWRTGDTNGDGCVDDADLLAVLLAFGTQGTGYTRHDDINKDGIVDDADLLTVLFNFGSGC
ncbi:MAG: hypothetical protein KatS3mg020_1097 [Fimbriimonadales bacterium]|nr:MAG: hypothetical protein KatS3mg020_1097 [Fimbriimonadales bacterium]